MPRSGKKESVLTAGLLFLLSAGPLLGAVHELGSSHRYCPEHAALEESEADGRLGLAGDDRQLSSLTRGADVANAHEICAFGDVLCPKPALLSSAGPGQTLAMDDWAPRSVPPRGPPQVAILTLAPKTSPPAAR